MKKPIVIVAAPVRAAAPDYACGCDPANLKRCGTHADRVLAIRRFVEKATRGADLARLFELSDYPMMAGDWSAIRDSGPEGIDAMFAFATDPRRDPLFFHRGTERSRARAMQRHRRGLVVPPAKEAR